MTDYFFDVKAIKTLIKDAGKAALEIYHQDFAVYDKQDASPVTEADMLAEKIIFKGLSKISPTIPVVGEEHYAAGEIGDLTQEYFWLVDPIDGTADFVKKNGEFTINIALIQNDKPIFGAVYAPVKDELYYTETQTTAYKETADEKVLLNTRDVPEAGYTVYNSRTHCDENVVLGMLSGLKIQNKIPCGSSLKFCLIAEGKGDVYPCSHNTKEWDTAAAHAVLKAAGGEVYDALTGLALSYRKQNLMNPEIISYGKPLK